MDCTLCEKCFQRMKCPRHRWIFSFYIQLKDVRFIKEQKRGTGNECLFLFCFFGVAAFVCFSFLIAKMH